jgi:DNA-binding NarL/FixJ family response regulator
VTDPAGPFAGVRALVIEDEVLVAMMLEDILSDTFGCTVVAHHSRLKEGLEAARAVEADVAFLDLNLRGESSLSIAEVLRARGVPVLYTSGYDRPNVVLPVGARLVAKPYTAEHIGEALEWALRP